MPIMIWAVPVRLGVKRQWMSTLRNCQALWFSRKDHWSGHLRGGRFATTRRHEVIRLRKASTHRLERRDQLLTGAARGSGRCLGSELTRLHQCLGAPVVDAVTTAGLAQGPAKGREDDMQWTPQMYLSVIESSGVVSGCDRSAESTLNLQLLRPIVNKRAARVWDSIDTVSW